MTFDDVMEFIGGVVSFARTKYDEKVENIEKYKERYERLDDETLFRRWRSASGDEKIACEMLLKDRGYTRKEN